MAKIKTSLLNNSNSIEGIQNSINAFGASLRAANSSSSVIIRNFTEVNRGQKRAIIKKRELYGKRREAVRRREQEDLIEASRVGGIFRRTAKVIGSSTKGFLGRVMDFLGTILVGWLVTNVPIIINAVQDLIGRIQQAAGILKNWYEGTVNFFTGFTSNLGDVLNRLTSFDFQGSKDILDKGVTKLKNGARAFEQDFRNMIQMLQDFDLFKIVGNFARRLLGLPDKPGSPGSEQQGQQGQQGSASLPTGGTLDAKQIVQVARAAGIPEKDVPLMTAIALAESGGKSGAHNTKYPDNSYGLWQINMLDEPGYMLGEERRKRFGLKSNDELFNPITNAKAAYAILKQQGFGAWSVYTNRSYEQFLPAAKKAAAGPRTSSPVTSQIDSNTRYRVGQDVTQLLGGEVSTTITSTRGMQESFRTRPHGGIDLGCPAGVYISLTADAEVVASGSYGAYGYLIDLWIPSQGVQLRFAHNSKIIIPSGKVPAGTSFAITGSTGRSTGPHIHLEASTERGSSNYGGNTSPAPYVALIRLTKAKIDGMVSSAPGDTISNVGGPSVDLQGTGSRNQVAQGVTPEKRGSVITVPIPSSSSPSVPMPQSGGEESISIPSGTTLNSFITKALLRELEYV